MPRRVLLILLLIGAMAVPCGAKTLVVTGRLSSEVTVTQQVTFGVDQKLSRLTYRFPVPAAIRVPSISQRLSEHRMTFDPQPVSVKDETDAYGNLYKVVVWGDLTGDAGANIVFTTAIEAVLDPLANGAPFPPRDVPEDARLYLKPSKLVQSADPEVKARAADLTAGAATEWAAVDAVINFVADHIRYETPPKAYDALFGLTTGTGNCQNYAHLACALLRASGIPARVAVGLTLKEKWKIPLDDRGSSLVQGMGEGLHAWIEVWFPGLGWLPCDPQQTKQFTSTRHIKYSHGPECGQIGTSWRASPVLPRYASVVSSVFNSDLVDLKLKGSGSEPRGYMASFEMIAAGGEALALPPALPPPLPAVGDLLPKPGTAERKLAAERKSAQLKLAEQKLAELKSAQKKLAEQKLAEQKLAERQLEEQRLAELELAERRLAERRSAEKKLAQQKLAEQEQEEKRLAEQRLAEKILARQKSDELKQAEQRLTMQKFDELRLAEQKLAEQRLAEQRLADRKRAEQILADEQLAQRKLAEQRLAEQKLAELRLVELKLAERKLAERKLEEQKLAERRLAELKVAEEKLAELKLAVPAPPATPDDRLKAMPVKKPVGPPPLEPDREGNVVFGNTRFPANISLYTSTGDRGEASLERETAEYATSASVYAQAFSLDRQLRLDKVSLAIKKFGGDGTVYLDIVADDNGKPGLTSGVRSQPVYLENVKRTPGYGWLDFSIPPDSEPFQAGKYWVVLRRSGEAILNWYYTPGKPFGGPDDTRSTARGWQWEDVLAYDFVFKVAGRVVR